VACDDFVPIQADPDEGNLRAAVAIKRDKVGGVAGFDEISDFLRDFHWYLLIWKHDST